MFTCVMEPSRGSFNSRPPLILKTSAEIVSEARAAMATRPVNTKRPFTPIERQRTLFGSLKNGTKRPPSSFSLRQVEFQEVDSVKLPPLKSLNGLNKSHTKLTPWKLPELGSRVHCSLSNLPEEVETETPCDNPWINNNIIRETHSSPQERTTSNELHPKGSIGNGSCWFNRDYLLGSSRGKSSSKKRAGTCKGLFGPLDKRAGLKIGSAIKETDEESHPDVGFKGKKELFKSPTIFPLGVDNSPESELVENRLNEEKAILTKGTVEVVAGILQELGAIKESDINEETLVALMDKLFHTLKTDPVRKDNPKLQSHIIKSIYRFVENATDTLLLHICKVLLLLKVRGQNLSSVNKLIFKVSRTDKNDALFLQGDILELFVESLGRSSPIDDAEACIYGYGAVKFLTMNQQLLLVMLKLGILELMVLHLKIVNNARLELLAIPEQTSHAMFQLTGALRNVGSEEVTAPYFVKTGALTQLCVAMEIFTADLDLISNIARTISILSTHEDCCKAITKHEGCFRSISKILMKYPGRQDIIVRFGYALGNIIARSDSARIKLYKEPGAISAVLSLLESYMDKDLEQMKATPMGNQSDQTSPEWASDGSVEDVIIKMIRIIANMSMHPEVGTSMTCLPLGDKEDTPYAVDHHNARDGGRFLDLLLMVLRRKSVSESEELVTSTLCTLNNLSYYAEPEVASDGPFALRQIEITQVLSTLLLTNNEESMIEVTRVLGNLTRSKDVRDYILEIGGISQLVRCLETENKELLFTTTGVLVNLMADWDKRLAFKENNGVQKLIWVLSRSGEGDWRLASLICQALWNFCIDSTHLYAALGVQPTNDLLNALVDLLDEERLFGITEGLDVPDTIADSPEYRLWESFAAVATNLLEKIEQYLESLQAFQDK